MTQNELEKLSHSLDELNSGHISAANDSEPAGLLEIAALLKRADLPVAPPPHILAAATHSAAAGITAAKSRRNKWMYSGLLGAAASLLIFLGLNGLPDWQSSASRTVVSQTPSVITETQRILPDKNPDPPSAASPNSYSEPAAPPAEKSQRAVPVPKAVPESPPILTPKLAAGKAPAAAKAVPARPSLTPLSLPGRTPDSISADPATGELRQIYEAGTEQEIIITQRPQAQKHIRDSNGLAAEAGAARQKPAIIINKVTVVINDQEVTLESRKTHQELLDLAATLKP